TGEVANPGRFDLQSDTTVLQAIAIAGGLKAASAKHSEVILFRRINQDQAETKILNVKELMRSPNLQEDIALHPGDMLLVPQNRISKIERIVKLANMGVYWNPIPNL